MGIIFTCSNSTDGEAERWLHLRETFAEWNSNVVFYKMGTDPCSDCSNLAPGGGVDFARMILDEPTGCHGPWSQPSLLTEVPPAATYSTENVDINHSRTGVCDYAELIPSARTGYSSPSESKPQLRAQTPLQLRWSPSGPWSTTISLLYIFSLHRI